VACPATEIFKGFKVRRTFAIHHSLFLEGFVLKARDKKSGPEQGRHKKCWGPYLHPEIALKDFDLFILLVLISLNLFTGRGVPQTLCHFWLVTTKFPLKCSPVSLPVVFATLATQVCCCCVWTCVAHDAVQYLPILPLAYFFRTGLWGSTKMEARP
jgi:hypothetical protein